MNTKAILKYLKLNESNISMILGALVIVILGFIVINYFRRDTGQIETGTTSETKNSEQPTIKRGEGPVQYTVSSGESLWSIALKQYGSGYNWVDIQKANAITNPDAINTGQKLTVPDVAPRNPAVANENSKTNTGSISSQPAQAGSTYKVAKGDSLWNISVKIYGDGNQWTKIATANKLANPNIIHSGNSLSIPR